MTLQSMTGFAYVEGSKGDFNWAWEIKSVNGKSLDMRWRLPGGFDFLELELRKKVSEKLSRGNLQINLSLEGKAVEKLPFLNAPVLEAVLKIVDQVSSQTKIAPPTIDGILNIKGVMEYREGAQQDEANIALHNQALLSSFEEAVNALQAARLSEGASIEAVLSDQVEQIANIKQQIDKDPSRSADAIRASIAEKVSKLLEDSTTLDEQRLHQEAAILATKADLQEELDRLDAHCKAAKELLSSEGAVGRKLDFLAQEFNRECNTICSKANSTAVTQAGLKMKVVIDQFREQIQNIQ